MRPLDLKEFYQLVKIWPKNQSEMDFVAEQVQKLLKVSFVCIFFDDLNQSIDSGTSIGLSFSGASDLKSMSRTGFAAFLRDHWRVNKASEISQNELGVVVPIQVQSGSFKWPFSQSIQSLNYIFPTEAVPTNSKFLSGIIVGTDTPMTQEASLVFTSVFQYLVTIGKICDLDSDIKLRSQFLSIASHELKTPLTSIYGILQLQERMLRLKKDQPSFPDQERHHSFLKMVIRQVERLNELIDGLLDVSRIQNGRFMVEPTETDVVALLKDCVQSRLTVIAQEAGVQLSLDTIPQLNARVDPVRMEEVIMNLVMNAIRFSPEGGVVWIRLRSDDGSFRLTVRDQGPSIPPEDRERIFQPFERAQRTGRMGGLGLGLFISRQIAFLHGGNVSLIESVPGKGNLFEAYFPYAKS